VEVEALQTPVALFVFKRPDTTRRVFDAVSRVRPTKLLLVADGPRQGKKGEAEACRQVRDIVTSADWPCEVLTNFAENNLGCRERMVSGLDWVFSLVNEAILLEDDCLPDLSFFYFCHELLERYRCDGRVAYICGCNLVEKYTNIRDSYYFSRIGGIWGWATWRYEWQRYDRKLSDWPEIKRQQKLAEVLDDPEAIEYWTRIFDAMHENRGPDTWDYQWSYTVLKNNSLAIVPKVNLVTNLGFGEGATHTTETDDRFILPASSLDFPLRHPSNLIPLRSLDSRRVHDMLPPSIFHRVLKRLRRATGLSLK
jgi:hypothetical protein